MLSFTSDYEQQRPKVLQKTKIKLIGEKKCRNLLKNKHRIRLGNEAKTVLCADTTKTDSCQGDSGGPLFRKEGSKWIVYGLASFGYRGVVHGFLRLIFLSKKYTISENII